jgi:RNA polymerase sigma-70 factor (ECF subfamily)
MKLDELEAHIPRLRRYALALLRDRVEADDLVQDTLERALRKSSLWRRGSDLRAWLFTIMHNVYVNRLRRERTNASVPQRESEIAQLAVDANHDAALEARDLAAALASLPAEYRSVVLLVGLEQLSYQEAASVLGVPVGTVMSRLSRGRERLRALMSGEPVPHLRRIK